MNSEHCLLQAALKRRPKSLSNLGMLHKTLREFKKVILYANAIVSIRFRLIETPFEGLSVISQIKIAAKQCPLETLNALSGSHCSSHCALRTPLDGAKSTR